MIITIIAIRKDNGDHYDPYESIQAFKFKHISNNEINTCYLRAMIDFIEDGGHAYVGTARCVVAKGVSGNKYVKTIPDSNPENNLLSLPEF